MKKLILGILLLPIFASAGHDQSGGGGLINKNGELKTLPEAGILLEKASNIIPKVYPKYLQIDEATKEATRKLINDLPFSSINDKWAQQFSNVVIGGRDTFIDESNVNQNEYDGIVKDYQGVLAKYGYHLDVGNFSLAAISKKCKTYILPNFKKLNADQKAYLLLHEYFMRDSNNDCRNENIYIPYTGIALPKEKLLPIALEFDTQLFKCVEAIKSGNKFDLTRMLLVFKNLNLLIPDVESALVIWNIQNSLFKPMLLSNFVADPSGVDVGWDQMTDPSLVQELNPGNLALAQTFEGATVTARSSNTFYSLPEKSRENVKMFCDENKSAMSEIKGDLFIYSEPETKLTLGLDCKIMNWKSIAFRNLNLVY